MTHDNSLVKGPDPVVWAERDARVAREQEAARKQQEAHEERVRRQREAFEAKKRKMAESLSVEALRFPGSWSDFDAEGFVLARYAFSGEQVRRILEVAEANGCDLECEPSYDDAVVFTLKPREKPT